MEDGLEWFSARLYLMVLLRVVCLLHWHFSKFHQRHSLFDEKGWLELYVLQYDFLSEFCYEFLYFFT